MAGDPCVFFDRDGVLNVADVRDGKAYSPRCFADFHLVPEAAGVVRAVQAAGYRAVVVTNQPDIARGLMPLTELERMLAHLREQLSVDAVYYCPHDDCDGCDCRKPKPGMLRRAAREHQLDLARSWLIGDSWKDMAAGRAAGLQTVLLQRDYNRQAQADYRIEHLQQLPGLLDIAKGASE